MKYYLKKKKKVGQINSSFFNSKILLFSFLNNSTQTILVIAAFFSTSKNILVFWIERRTPGYILPSPHLCASTCWQFCPQHRSWIPSMPRSAGQVWLRSYTYKYSYERYCSPIRLNGTNRVTFFTHAGIHKSSCCDTDHFPWRQRLHQDER